MQFMSWSSVCVLVGLLLALSNGQEYNLGGGGDYGRAGGGGRRRNGNQLNKMRPWGMFAAGSVLGATAATLWQRRKARSSLTGSSEAELLNYIQKQEERINLVDQQWQAEYKKLYTVYQDLEKDVLERDYEEFKAPDTNDDNMITRAEFNTYVRKYLSSFPELSEKDFPLFDEFDEDVNGVVSFAEWQDFLAKQKLMEEQKAAGGTYDDLVQALYEQEQEETLRKNALPVGGDSSAKSNSRSSNSLLGDKNNRNRAAGGAAGGMHRY